MYQRKDLHPGEEFFTNASLEHSRLDDFEARRHGIRPRTADELAKALEAGETWGGRRVITARVVLPAVSVGGTPLKGLGAVVGTRMPAGA